MLVKQCFVAELYEFRACENGAGLVCGFVLVCELSYVSNLTSVSGHVFCSLVLITRRLNRINVVHYTLSFLPHRHNKETIATKKDREKIGETKEGEEQRNN